MKGRYTVTETVVNNYSFHYDEEELSKRGLTLQEYLDKYDGNIWKAMQEDDLLSDLQYEECFNYLEADFETAEIE